MAAPQQRVHAQEDLTVGMKEDIQADLAEAFDDPDGLADTVKPVDGVRKVIGDYDPDSGSAPEVITNYVGRGVFGSYLAKEVDGTLIMTTDTKLLILQNELFISVDGVATTEPIAPLVGDMIGGKRAMNVGADPADATWTVQLRV